MYGFPSLKYGRIGWKYRAKKSLNTARHWFGCAVRFVFIAAAFPFLVMAGCVEIRGGGK
jgi:hypothetical protein